MSTVITYGTYDLLHYGHIRLLERARKLGDYLIVGVTADDFDKTRGKINVEQSLAERMEAVRSTGLADMVIVEEYEGQKIDDIRRYDVDIFTVGSDWEGKFDYLRSYCEVVYLDRTQGVSSSGLRSEKRTIKVGFVGSGTVVQKYLDECSFVNGIEISGQVLADEISASSEEEFDSLLDSSDAVYISTNSSSRYSEIRKALDRQVHVLCESPIVRSREQCAELHSLAKEKGLVLADAIKTAYATAYARLLLLAKSGRIGDVVSVDATCTSLAPCPYSKGAMDAWAAIAVLPIIQLLGDKWISESYAVRFAEGAEEVDSFVKADFVYENAVASFKVGRGVKSEGELIISGTEGYIYVPAPWWKTDYFEIRRENTSTNKRYFYQLDGEGIRYQLVAFIRAIEKGVAFSGVSLEDSLSISGMMDSFASGRHTIRI